MDIEQNGTDIKETKSCWDSLKGFVKRHNTIILILVLIIACVPIAVVIRKASASIKEYIFSRTTCYHDDGVGCFTTASPYNNFQGFLPDSPADIQVGFWLYTWTNKQTPQQVTKDPSSIQQSYFDATNPTKFIIHGYRDESGSPWIQHMAQSFLLQEDLNVFAVNWEKGADNVNYIQSASNTQVVGALLAQFITQLYTTAHARNNSIHLIGHSLGAHISGFSGSRVHGLGRITGLDPAGPLFEEADIRSRLDPTDALYVDAIHTDGDSLSELGFGIGKLVGDVDFFPNGGDDQPGCVNEVGRHLFSFITGKITGFATRIGCSHMRVVELFTESITTQCTFRAQPCDNKNDFVSGKCSTCGSGCAAMGYHSDLTQPRGSFYLRTHAQYPYCIGD